MTSGFSWRGLPFDRRRRLDWHWWRPASQGRVPESVEPIEDEPSQQPPTEPDPSQVRQAAHYENAQARTRHTNEVDKRHPERSRSFRIDMAQYDYANTHQRKREQRSDIGQVVCLSGITNQRPERDKKSRQHGGDVRRAIFTVNFARPLRQQSVTGHREENAWLAILEHQQHRRHGEYSTEG